MSQAEMRARPTEMRARPKPPWYDPITQFFSDAYNYGFEPTLRRRVDLGPAVLAAHEAAAPTVGAMGANAARMSAGIANTLGGGAGTSLGTAGGMVGLPYADALRDVSIPHVQAGIRDIGASLGYGGLPGPVPETEVSRHWQDVQGQPGVTGTGRTASQVGRYGGEVAFDLAAGGVPFGSVPLSRLPMKAGRAWRTGLLPTEAVATVPRIAETGRALVPRAVPLSERALQKGVEPFPILNPAPRQSVSRLPAPVPPIYSRLERAARGLEGKMFKEQSLPNLLKKAPEGVSQEEMDWVLKGLPSKGGVVKKEDLLRHIDANQIRVEEKIFAKTIPEADYLLAERLGNLQGAYADAIERNSFSEAERILAESQRIAGGRTIADLTFDNPTFDLANKTKWAEHVTPGGSNYREVLFKLPSQKNANQLYDEANSLLHDLYNRYPNEAVAITRPKEYQRFLDLQKKAELAKSNPNYISPHWSDDPNTFAHLQLTDRRAPDGGKVLYVEGAQSDWHQAGAKEGYKNVTPTMQDFAKAADELEKTGGNPADIQRLTQKMQNAPSGAAAVPDAPFKGTGWVELQMKKLLQMATEGGYDRIAWNNGALAAKYNAGGVTDPKILAGIKRHYDETMVNEMAKLLKKEGRKFDPMPLTVEGKEHIVPSFIVPQSTKKRIASKGQPLLNLAPWMLGGGMGTTAAAQESR